MKSGIILLAIASLAFGSCSTVYKSGQTPDDVYYSPAREKEAYVQVEKRSDGDRNYRADNDRNYRNYDDTRYESSDDRWLRMRVRNRYRWSEFDEYDWNDYRYNSYSSNYYNPYSFNSYFNNYWQWNNSYNPYCPRVIIVNPKTNPVVYNKVRNFSLGSYTNVNYNNSRPAAIPKANRGIIRPSYNNTNTSNSSTSTNNPGLGTSIRKVFSNSNSRDTYSPSSSDRPTRTYTPSSDNSGSSNNSSRSSSNSSSGGSSSSGGGGVSRPTRGGN